MEQRIINYITLNELISIVSENTYKPLMDENGYAVFCTNDNIEIFKNKYPNAIFSPPIYYQTEPLFSRLYELGYDGLNIDNEYLIHINRIDVKNQYYNHSTNRNLIRLKQTARSKYLYRLKKARIITPSFIVSDDTDIFSGIKYASAKMKNKNQIYYVAFTNLSEFEEWNMSENGHKWKPLELDFNTLNHVRKNNSVLLNPLSDKLILSDKMLNKIKNYKMED